MKTIWIKHLIEDEDWDKWKQFYSEDQLRSSLREVGVTGVEDCVDTAIQYNAPQRNFKRRRES